MDAGRERDEDNVPFYGPQLPEEGQLVMGKIHEITETGVVVHLPEYGNCEGFIFDGELSRKRVHSVRSMIQVGREEIMSVIRVDRDRGYIDLSKKNVQPGPHVDQARKRFRSAATVHGLLRRVAHRQTSMSLEELAKSITWPMYASGENVYRAFGNYSRPWEIRAPERNHLSGILRALPDDVREVVKNAIVESFRPKSVKMTLRVKVNCYTAEGVLAIRRALLKAEEATDGRVKVRIDAAPTYMLITEAMDLKQGVSDLEAAEAAVRTDIEAAGGSYERGRFSGAGDDPNDEHDEDNDNDNDEDEDASDDSGDSCEDDYGGGGSDDHD